MSLSTKQLRRIIAVIQKDARVRHLYLDEQGRTCAIGGLAKAAGIKLPPTALIGMGIRADGVTRFAANVAHAYDLTLGSLEHIQVLNDNTPTLRERRRRIIEYVRSLASLPP